LQRISIERFVERALRPQLEQARTSDGEPNL
jgi:hypothetical protein